MLKRLNCYFNEMYPVLPRLLLGYLISMEIYFIVLLNQGVTDFTFGVQELVLGFTVFSFLGWLRIADDFKDYEHDCRLFPHRPLPLYPAGKIPSYTPKQDNRPSGYNCHRRI